MTTTVNVLREVVLPRLRNIKKTGVGYMACCPAHDDNTASLSITQGREHPVVLHCHAGCDQTNIINQLGLTWADLSNPRPPDPRNTDNTWMPCGWDPTHHRYDTNHRKTAEYPYRNPDGQLVFAVARCALKGNGCQGFRQWRPDPTAHAGRRWSRTLPDGTKVGEGLPYRLPQALAAIHTGRNIWIVEGEKDADRLAALGVAAVCNAEGAGKWTAQHAAWLTNADIIIVTDRDDSGWIHAERVTNTLLEHARSIEIVRAAVGKDTCDHLNAGLHIGQFVQITVPLPAPTAVPDCSDCNTALGRSAHGRT